MICKNIVKRSYQRKPYLYCRKDKRQITFEDCKKCSKFEPRLNKAIKKRSSKQAKIERDRDKGLIKKGICEFCR